MEIILFFIFLPIISLVLWQGICFIILHFSDYLSLSEYYKVGLIYKKPLRKARYAILGFINLQNALYIGIYKEGLYLAITKIFRIKGAKLLLVTWSDIKILEKNLEQNKFVMSIGEKQTKLIVQDKNLFQDFQNLY